MFDPSKLLSALLASFAITSSPPAPKGVYTAYKPQHRTAPNCPGYTHYAEVPHPPYSSGPLKLPNMRPAPECRTFNSSAVEKVISDMTDRLKDPDLAQLFANTFPSTLDTTVSYFDPEANLAFIVTGDITAQWLRDTTNQLAQYYKLLPKDPELKALVKAVINTEARYIKEYPYCGAFQPPPESGLAPTLNDWALNVEVSPPVDNQTVFECKYPSLATELIKAVTVRARLARRVIKTSTRYYDATLDASFINDNWKAAIDQIMTVIHDQSQSSWDENFNFVSYYNWTGTADSLAGPVTNGGHGEPKLANGLVGSHHRPSDDRVIFSYITPVNAMLSVELHHLAEMLDSLQTLPQVASLAHSYSATIRQAIFDHTLTPAGIFAYETNGYGGQYVMDDTNVPSLVALPYLGFLDREDEVYRKTKDALFSRANPYYAEGVFTGIGGPHIHATFPWPMSQISGIYGASSDAEILHRLYAVINSTASLGLIHESVSIYNMSDYTRPWYVWANSYFAEMVLDLAERKPHLIFGSGEAYVAGQ